LSCTARDGRLKPRIFWDFAHNIYAEHRESSDTKNILSESASRPALPYVSEVLPKSLDYRARVEREILALSDAEMLRLRKYAVWRVRGLGRKAQGRNAEDLLNEAMTSIIDGTREWPPTIPFYIHLRGCIRSISNAWSQKNSIDLWLESEIDNLVSDSQQGKIPLFERARETRPDPEELAHVAIQVDRMHRIFPCGTTDRQIIDCWASGQSHSEAQARLGLSKKVYEAAVKRIRRTADSKRAFVYGEEYI